ncbi:MAG TPA: DNA replication and repair protein RecF, partial [Anaerolineaceae bacterium]|nr:DNA replication and repair protein RecF [Anaerolineaceae bacterium]
PLAVARLVAEFDREGKHHRMEVRLIQEPVGPMGSRTRKEILVDGVKRTAQEALGIFNAVIFLPQMMTILEGGPDERRRYLNLAISQAIPGYARALSEYQQALTQRNALLKQLSERGGAPDQLLYWDEILADRGSLIIYARIAAIQEMERIAAEFHEKLTRREEVLRLVYQPAYDPARPQNGQMGLPIQTPVQRNGIPMAQIRQGFVERLSAIRGEEIARGMTTIGPHRDELRFLGNGRDLGDYGSRGQMRTALLALKLAEVQWLKQRTGQNPVLLLDEILAELDVQRRSDLLNTLLDVDQALFTTTDLNLFDPSFVEQCAVWRVSSGKVQPELD